ncbi:MAG: HAD-IA family hydrolase [Bdellovibrionales bacterium]|nr:HAD-IA family hydrolase [Bdellovibrionales bacterium]
MKYWVFDLDGTLTDSFGHYFSTLESLLGQNFSRLEKKHLIGIHPLEIFSSQLPAEEATRAMQVLQEKSESEASLVPTYHAIDSMCAWLANSNRKIAVWTSRDLESAKLVLHENRLLQYFDHVVSGNCVSRRKPHPEGLSKIQEFFSCETSEMVMVGDHDHDMQAAKIFGALPIRASWHNYWDHDVCSNAQRQFFCSTQFFEWVKSLGL